MHPTLGTLRASVRREAQLPVFQHAKRRPAFGPNSRVGRRGAKTQARILNAGLQILDKSGYHGARVEAIADLAGCSRPTFYQYFEDKAELFRQLAAQLDDELGELAQTLGPIDPSLEGRNALFSWFEDFVALHHRRAPVFRSFEAVVRSNELISRGGEAWVLFLSEPTGGSDLAAVMTRATPDGDAFILNGSKIWSSGAYAADYAICVARTDWEVPKHRGITVLIVEVDQPGITVDRILGVAGDNEFCQEFFDDVRIAAEAPVRHLVQGQTARRVTAGMASGHFPPTSGALLRLMGARSAVRRADIAIEIAGAGAAAWQRGDTTGPAGVRFLARQGSELGRGSTETQRNIIGERVLGMPREYAADRDVLFSQVRRNAMPTRG